MKKLVFEAYGEPDEVENIDFSRYYGFNVEILEITISRGYQGQMTIAFTNKDGQAIHFIFRPEALKTFCVWEEKQ